MGLKKVLGGILLLWACGASLAQAQDQKLFSTQTPAKTNLRDGVNYELGMRFTSTAAGKIKAIRFYKASSESGSHVGKIYSASGKQLASVTFSRETNSGWQQQALTSPLSIAANTEYVVSVNTGNMYYVASNNGLASQIVSGNLRSVVGNNGVYGPVGTKPSDTYQNTNYFRDVVFAVDTAPAPSPSPSPAPAPAPSPSGQWNNSSFSTQTANFNISFDAVPTAAMGSEDAVIGLSSAGAAAYTDLAVIVRFSDQGVDARNGRGYAPTPGFAYNVGTKYRFDIAVDIGNHRYTVKVGPSGGTMQTLGSNFAFRGEQTSVGSLANFANYSSKGGVTISNFTLSAGSPSPSPAPSPAPAPAPSPTPAPSPAPGGNCTPPNYSGCGYPDASNTGVPAGIVLRSMPFADCMVISDDNTVIDGIQMTGCIDVEANNVTIKNSHITASDTWWAIQYGVKKPSVTGLKILNNKIDTVVGKGPDSGGYPYAIAPNGDGTMEVAYNDISGFKDGLDIVNGSVHHNYIHHIGYYGEAHTQVIYVWPAPAGGSIKIFRNTLINESPQAYATASIYIVDWIGGHHDVTVTDNWLAGGAYTLYGGGADAKNMVIQNNMFSVEVAPNGGFFGPVTSFKSGNAGNVWSGNIWINGSKKDTSITPGN